jgi:hypothetical protein
MTRLGPLVFQSKDALHDGQRLCQAANDIATAASDTAINVLHIHAKAVWLSTAILDQLNVRTTPPPLPSLIAFLSLPSPLPTLSNTNGRVLDLKFNSGMPNVPRKSML